MNLKILFFGDIVGKPGRRALAKVAPTLRKQYEPDLVIANAENIAHGVGVTVKTLEEAQKCGVDFFTSGNHIWAKDEVYEIFQKNDFPIIRPANYPSGTPGLGEKIVTLGTKSVLVVNLMGRVFMEEDIDDPFRKLDEILMMHARDSLTAVIVDFHAEATSEKQAFGFYADGKVSAVLGTHTHVGTADTRILPKGTGYITDIGMVGPRESVIGVDKDIIIKKFLTQRPLAHKIPDDGSSIVNAVLLTIDPKTRKATHIERIDRTTTV